jgi:RHS repeat-associated protein
MVVVRQKNKLPVLKGVLCADGKFIKRHYFIKNQLGNVRMVLTEEQQTDGYPAATMETAKAQLENTYYQNIEETRSAKPPGYPDDPYTDPNTQAAKLNGNGNKIGPAILLKVMSGDQVNIRANAWYRLSGNQPGNPVSPVNDLLAALSGAVTNFVHGKFSAVQLQQPGVLTPGIADMVTQQTNDYSNNSKPKAYLNWVLLDEQFKYVSSSSGFEQVGEDQELKTFLKAGLPINRNGYLYVFTNNTSPVDVYFDNLQVSHVRGPLLSESHYSPWGMELAAISSKAAGKMENRMKFNDATERTTDLDINIDETDFRSYDPQIGRFLQIDPLGGVTESYSPYAYVLNNPLLYNDPLGLDTVRVGFKDGQTSASATNADGSTGTYQQDEAGNVNGTGMSGSGGDVTVTSTKKAKTTGGSSTPSGNAPPPNNPAPDHLVWSPDHWRTQAPNWSACFTTSETIANYIAPRNLAIQTARENGNSLQILPAAQQGVQTINAYLSANRPIIVGVNHTLGNTYNEGTTDHFVVIVGSGFANGMTYYRFYDPGTMRMAAGTSPLNRLYLRANFRLQGTTQYNGRTYTVSQVRPGGR